MKNTHALCPVLSGLVLAALGAGLLAIALNLVPPPSVDRPLAELMAAVHGDPLWFGLAFGGGVLGLLLGYITLRRPFGPREAYRYDTEAGQVVVPLALLRQITEDVLKGYPEVVEARVGVEGGGRRLPRLSLDMQVTGRTAFVELGKKLRGHLHNEIAQQTGVELKEITMRMAVTDKKPAMYLPRTAEVATQAAAEPAAAEPAPAVAPPPAPPVDLSKIDLDLKPSTPAPGKRGADGGTEGPGQGREDKDSPDFPPATWRV